VKPAAAPEEHHIYVTDTLNNRVIHSVRGVNNYGTLTHEEAVRRWEAPRYRVETSDRSRNIVKTNRGKNA
jgi:hypothetical protein